MYKCHSDVTGHIGTVVLHLATRWLPCPTPYTETGIIRYSCKRRQQGSLALSCNRFTSVFSHTCCWPCDEGSCHGEYGLLQFLQMEGMSVMGNQW